VFKTMAAGAAAAEALRVKSTGETVIANGLTVTTGTVTFPANSVAVPRGYIDGCIMANGTDATNDINVAAGVCRDSTNTVNINLSALTGKQLDANWAAGSAAGMRNSGAGIADTTYHIYAVAKALGADPDIYAHTSTTVATVITALQAESGGASYLYARRIGSIVRASAAILAFTQVGDIFRVKTPSLDISTAVQSTTSVTYTLARLPVGLTLDVTLNVSVNQSGGTVIYFRHPDDTDTAPSDTVAPLGQIRSAGARNSGQVTVFCNTSAQIAARSSNSATSVDAAVTSYRDARGVDA
jgi:hypothetical protein